MAKIPASARPFQQETRSSPKGWSATAASNRGRNSQFSDAPSMMPKPPGCSAWRFFRRPLPVNDEQREVLAGLVERVTFHNEENGFCVLRVKTNGRKEALHHHHRSRCDDLAGEWVTASGSWQNDRTHGLQFRAQFLKTTEPTSIFRGYGEIPRFRDDPGIGPVYAKRLLKAFATRSSMSSKPHRSACGR